MNDVDQGIVIKQIDYKDNDAIITIISKEFGKIALYVKGFKKINSKNRYACQLLDESEFLFDYNENSRMQILKSANLHNEHNEIKNDYERLVVGSMIAELADSLPEAAEYALLSQTIDKLETTKQVYLVLNLFLVAVLTSSGIAPNVDNCTLCGQTKDIEAISVEDGGFICQKCNKQLHLSPTPISLLRSFRVTNKASFAVYDKLLDLNMNDYHISELLIQFISEYLGIELKSYRSLQKLHN